MQENGTAERELVMQCLEELCKRSGFSDRGQMVQRDFEFLCDRIESETHVNISLSTMRRLVNGQFSRLPQVATLNALAVCLGFKHWQDFRQSRMKETETITHAGAAARLPAKRFLLWVIVLAVVSIGLFTALKIGKTSSGNYESARFSAHKTTHNDIPNTVVFRYDIDDVNADSFFIQQSWDRNRRVRIYKNAYTLTDIYYEPGYHTAKLIANDSVIRTEDVSIPTDGWFLCAKDLSPASNPEYIKHVNAVRNGTLTLEKQDLMRNGIDIQQEKEYVYTYFPSTINVSGDNYVLKTRLRIKEVRNNFCPYMMVEVFCQKHFMFFKSASKGCSGELSLQFGERYLSGKNVDLSSLGCDPLQWVNVELTVRDKNVTVTIDGEPVFSMSYEHTTGLITGFGFMSNGLCEIDFVDLRGEDGQVVYQHDFSAESVP